jgi:hypothetical protein
MKQTFILSAAADLFLIFALLVLSLSAAGQETSAPLPDNVNKIVSFSCMPCHSSNGGLLSRSKLNFTEWNSYSAEKQKKKAGLMYKELKKSAMPPKDARENNPDIIPTKEQIEIIKAWADSLQNENK